MSSTRSKNTPGDYRAEHNRFNNANDYLINKDHSYGQPVSTYFPGDGLLPGRVASENLSYNNVDIETQLFGIGSTNLVNHKGESAPQIKPLHSLSIINRTPIIIPEPLIVHKDQRPSFN
jgi:hypothetical protein|uniref:Uncharacterized protein n=1 Tax=viral metagenome TaxID=1070528 RepID=A0A6C0JR93_9ZZZZ